MSVPELADYFKKRGAASARFEPDPEATAGRDCSTCGRKTLSYPDTCGIGWERVRGGKLAPCLNFQVAHEMTG